MGRISRNSHCHVVAVSRVLSRLSLQEAAMKRVAGLLIAGVMLLTSVTAQKSSPTPGLDVELQRVVHREVATGDVKSAIEAYRIIAQRAERDGDRAVAAQALLRLAISYQKFGDAEAGKVLARLVKEFRDQPGPVAEARRRLEREPPEPRKTTLGTRLISTLVGRGPDIETVTPDGRLGIGADWSNGDLVIRDLGTGKLTRLLPGTLDARSLGPMAAAGQYVAWPVISPDNRSVAFARYGDPSNPTQGQLWVMPLEPGAKPRLVSSNPEYRNLPPQAWSLDGTSVLVNIERVQDGYQIAWISIADGRVKVLKSFGWDPSPDYRLRVSPDGRYIAYSANLREQSRDRAIFILAADGSLESILTQTAGLNESPVWTPDGKHILFVSNRAGSFDLWAVPVHEGKAAGLPSLIKKDIGRAVDLGMTRAGSLFYTLRDVARNRIDSVSLAEMTSSSPPGALTQASIGLRPSWSGDGKYLAFTRRSQGSPDPSLVVHHLPTGEERVFSAQRFRSAMPVWLGNGERVLALVQKEGAPRALVAIDIKSGESREVLELDASTVLPVSFALSPDGGTVFIAGYGSKEASNEPAPLDRVRTIEVATGRQREIFHASGRTIVAVRASPDGRSLAFVTQDSSNAYLAAIDIDGKNHRELTSDVRAAMGGLAWAPQGGALFFGRRVGANQWRVFRSSLDGSSISPTSVQSEEPIQSIDVHPDGSRVVIGSIKTIEEVWALDNVLSVLK
jgi:Tol biopolymer transport system component